jgi:hypothetical protein
MFRLNRLVYRDTRDLKALANVLRNSPQVIVASNVHNKAADAEIASSSNSNAFQVESRDIEREISLFGPKDYRAPLPGNVGLGPKLEVRKPEKKVEIERGDVLANSDILTHELPLDRHVRIVEQVLYPAYEESQEDEMKEDQLRRSAEILECVAHECPELMAKDFQELFPSRHLDRNTTVITICQRSKMDMASWSPEMEQERDELMEHFMQLAQEFTNKLNEAGFWADYIDPYSGRAYNGPYSNATLFETDERYRKLGFEIDDLGCCKVTRHHRWGSKSFVGCLFTNAPIHSTALSDLLRILSSQQD